MVGFNPDAAKTAGISVDKTYILAMGLSAAFVGVAAGNQALGVNIGMTPSSHANIGFDAITVALLGGSSAPGVLLAGLLFGAFKAGAPSMQVIGVSPEVLGIVQGAIVLFIAAPPLIRAMFRLPKPQTTNALGAITSKWFKRGGAK
jgi:simple sugar transport system permease protein